jgi:hypothetical protein
MATKTKTTRANCNSCHGEKNHHVLHAVTINGSRHDPEWYRMTGETSVDWSDTYTMVRCLGCDSVSFQHAHWFEPTQEWDITDYPPPIRRGLPDWHESLPDEIQGLLSEVYHALAADSRRLALMGARTLVDMLMVSHVGAEGSFTSRLSALHTGGFIGERQKDVLSAALDAGNAAAHRGYRPSSSTLNAVMDIVENLLASTYHLGSLADRLRKETPPRPTDKKPDR